MSWAAHNPEAYEEILKQAVVHKLTRELNANGFDTKYILDSDTTKAIVESIFESTDNYGAQVRDRLISWAQHEIIEAERDHFGEIAE
jgi:hypothetical protein